MSAHRFLPALALGLALCLGPAGPRAQTPAQTPTATPPCGQPAPGVDDWTIHASAQAASLDARTLCELIDGFTRSPRQLEGVVVERGGRLVAEAYRAGREPRAIPLFARAVNFDARTPHDMRSVTKSVVGLLWGIAAARGIVPGLDTPLVELFEGLDDLKTGGRERITVAHALAMRSGLAWDESGGYVRLGNDELGLMWRSDLPRYVLDRPMAAPAGTRFNYNGGLPALLALALQRRAGMDISEFARAHLFQPLGITDWRWGSDWRGRTRGFGGLHLRPRDAARIGRLMLDGGRWSGRQIVPEAWVRASLAASGPEGRYGYLWWRGELRAPPLDGVPWQGANGNGGQRIWLLPSLDLVVVTTAGEFDDPTIGSEAARLAATAAQAAALYRPGAMPAQPSTDSRASPAAGATEEIYTRAVVRAIDTEGSEPMIRLKIAPRDKLPFTTLSFRVREAALVRGFKAGDEVEYRARRVDGENVLEAIRLAPPCEPARPCR